MTRREFVQWYLLLRGDKHEFPHEAIDAAMKLYDSFDAYLKGRGYR